MARRWRHARHGSRSPHPGARGPAARSRGGVQQGPAQVRRMRREPALALPEEAREESARWGEEDRGREREPRRTSRERRRAPELPKFGDKASWWMCAFCFYFFSCLCWCALYFSFFSQRHGRAHLFLATDSSTLNINIYSDRQQIAK